MNLAISLKNDDVAIVKRLKSSLLKSFIPTKETSIEKGIELANYLVALDKLDEAQELLESFIYLDPSLNHLHLWVTNAQGLVLLVYIARVTNQLKKYQKLVTVLDEHDIWPKDIKRLRWYSMHEEDHKKEIEYALTATHKYMCGIIGQEVLTFMYFNEILLIHEKPNMWTKLKTKNLKSILVESQKLLVKCLQGRIN